MEFIVAAIIAFFATLVSVGAIDTLERGSLILINNGRVQYNATDRLGKGEAHFKRLVEHAIHVEEKHPEHAHAKWHEVASYVELHRNQWTQPTVEEVQRHMEELK